MADQLKSITLFQVDPGETISLPHQLHASLLACTPDRIEPDSGGLELSADELSITAYNPTGARITANVLAESWHSLERAFGDAGVTHLLPQPFIPAYGGGGGSGDLPPGGSVGAPLVNTAPGEGDWSPNNFMGNATIEELDGSATLRYNFQPGINPLGDDADETTAIHVRLTSEIDNVIAQYALFIEIDESTNFTHGGAGIKITNLGRGDSIYMALKGEIEPIVISGMTGSGVSPIVLTTTAPHHFGQGDVAQIAGCLGNTAANGVYYGFQIIDSMHIALPGKTGNGTYTAGSGTIRDIDSTIGSEAAAYGTGNIGSLVSMQRAGGDSSWQGLVALYMQPALLDYAAVNVVGVPNNAFSAQKVPGAADSTIDGLTQLQITEAAIRMIDGDGVPGGTFRGTWNPSTSYAINDTVVNGMAAYAATADSLNEMPPNGAFWADVTDATNSQRSRIGLYNNGEIIQSALTATADTTFRDSPEHHLRGTYWDGTASQEIDAIIKYVVTSDAPDAELRFYLGPPDAPQLSAILRPHAGGFGGDLDLQTGNLINCNEVRSATDHLDFYANATINMSLALPGEGETAMALQYNVGEIFTVVRVTLGAPDSGGTGKTALVIENP